VFLKLGITNAQIVKRQRERDREREREKEKREKEKEGKTNAHNSASQGFSLPIMDWERVCE
jgi:hypothetical protein